MRQKEHHAWLITDLPNPEASSPSGPWSAIFISNISTVSSDDVVWATFWGNSQNICIFQALCPSKLLVLRHLPRGYKGGWHPSSERPVNRMKSWIPCNLWMNFGDPCEVYRNNKDMDRSHFQKFEWHHGWITTWNMVSIDYTMGTHNLHSSRLQAIFGGYKTFIFSWFWGPRVDISTIILHHK